MKPIDIERLIPTEAPDGISGLAEGMSDLNTQFRSTEKKLARLRKRLVRLQEAASNADNDLEKSTYIKELQNVSQKIASLMGGVSEKTASQMGNPPRIALPGEFSMDSLKTQPEAQTDPATDPETYNDLLTKYQTYLEQRNALTAKYDTEIAALSNNPEKQKMASDAKQKALDDFAIGFAEQFPEFQGWAESIVTAAIEQLTTLLTAAQVALKELESDPNADPNATDKTQAKVATFQRDIAKNSGKESKEGDSTPKEKDIEQWTKLKGVLVSSEAEFRKLGKTMGGTFGEVIDVAMDIGASTVTIIDNVVKLTKSGAEGVEATGAAASGAMKKLETASAVLMIISAAMQIGKALFDLFKGGDTAIMKTMKAAIKFNEELRVMGERARINKDKDSIFGETLYKNFKTNIDVACDALENLGKTKDRILNRGKESPFFLGAPIPEDAKFEGDDKLHISDSEDPVTAKQMMEQDMFSPKARANQYIDPNYKWDNVEESIGDMQVQTRHSTWFRDAKYASLKDLVPELYGDDGKIDMEAMKEFANGNNDIFKKLSASNQELLTKMVADWETYEQAMEAVSEYLTSIFGGLGSTLTDALVDAFENGSDAAETFKQAVGKSLRQLAKDMIFSATLGKVFEDAQKKIEDISKKDISDEQKFQEWTDTLGTMVDDALGQQDAFNQMWEMYNKIAEEKGLSIGSEPEAVTQTGQSGALYTVSQDSFNRIEGLAVSIQMHTVSLDLKLDNIALTMSGQLDSLNAIAHNTNSLPRMYALFQRLEHEGIKVK